MQKPYMKGIFLVRDTFSTFAIHIQGESLTRLCVCKDIPTIPEEKITFLATQFSKSNFICKEL